MEELTKEQLEIEVMERKLAYREFKYYVPYIYRAFRGQEYILGKWHKTAFDALRRIETGELKRLIFVLPPGTGKSEIISRLFPSYLIGKYPSNRIMGISYSGDLASDATRDTKHIVELPKFRNLFPKFAIAKDKKQAAHWETSERGVYYGFGIDGSVTGKRFNIGIIDDYCKNRQDAESPTKREHLYNFYTSSFYTRKFGEDSSIIVMATRWHTDDLIGRLIEKQRLGGSDQWEVISIPALNKNDESFYPERFSSQFYINERNEVGPRDWEALYQGDPIKGSGNVFKKEFFKYFALSEIMFKDFTFAVHVDPAWSTREESDDLVVEVTMRHKTTREIYLLDGVAGPILPSTAFSLIVSWCERWKKYMDMEFLSVEKVDLSQKQGEFITGLENHIEKQGLVYTILYHDPKGGGKKEDRIKFGLEPMFNRFNIHFRCDDSANKFWSALETQLLKFPVGSKDDIIDCLTQGVIMWSKRAIPEKSSIQAAMDFYDDDDDD